MKEIKLTQGKVALVDDDIFEYLSQWKWCAQKHGKTFYAIRNEYYDGRKHRTNRMHRVIMKAKSGQIIDHADGNGLNCQEHNMRFATQSQNCMNRVRRNGSSKHKGVLWHKATGKWNVQVRLNGQRKSLGYFHDEKLAASAYNDFAKQHYGEFALLNQI